MRCIGPEFFVCFLDYLYLIPTKTIPYALTMHRYYLLLLPAGFFGTGPI